VIRPLIITMYAAKFIVAAAAVLAVADAKKHKKHPKKDAVTRGCSSPKEATFVIDGISRYCCIACMLIILTFRLGPPPRAS
jgi:hypothetical protein